MLQNARRRVHQPQPLENPSTVARDSPRFGASGDNRRVAPEEEKKADSVTRAEVAASVIRDEIRL